MTYWKRFFPLPSSSGRSPLSLTPHQPPKNSTIPMALSSPSTLPLHQNSIYLHWHGFIDLVAREGRSNKLPCVLWTQSMSTQTCGNQVISYRLYIQGRQEPFCGYFDFGIFCGLWHLSSSKYSTNNYLLYCQI